MDGHNFKKQFGQNFLKFIPDSIKLVDSVKPLENDFVFEIGPGDGRVTEILVQTVLHVVAVEIDDELIPLLKYKFGEIPNFELLHQDVLQVDFESELKKREITTYKVIGSLPYNISKKIIQKFVELDLKPQIMALVLQKEVAQDYAAESPKSSFLHHYVSTIYDTKYISTIRKDKFFPEPKVDGGILQLRLRALPLVENNELRDFAKFLKNAYSSPRKKLIKALSNIYRNTDWHKIFEEEGLDENLRPAQLTTENFVKLWKSKQK